MAHKPFTAVHELLGGDAMQFELRSLLSKQAEGLKDFEKDAWQQTINTYEGHRRP